MPHTGRAGRQDGGGQERTTHIHEKGQSFTRAFPRGKRHLKSTGETSKASVVKCSHFAFSLIRVHLSEKKKITPQGISL